MTPISDAIAAEVKGLKAAYKQAIGAARKGSKGAKKKKKNDAQTGSDAEVEPADAPGGIENRGATERVQPNNENQAGRNLPSATADRCTNSW